MRKNLQNLGYNDTIGTAAPASLIAMFGEILEQEAISAKHVADSLDDKDLASNVRQQFALLANLEDLTSDLLSGDYDSNLDAEGKRWQKILKSGVVKGVTIND